MIRLNVVELRQALADVLNRVAYQGERVVIHRRGKDAAALVSIEELNLLDRLIREAEDRADAEAARAALAESDERVPYEEFRRKMGLADGQKKATGARAERGARRTRAARVPR